MSKFSPLAPCPAYAKKENKTNIGLYLNNLFICDKMFALKKKLS